MSDAHGMIDGSIIRSKKGIKAVSLSLVILLVTAIIQGIIFTRTNSISLFADIIHNLGDALTALPLAIAFFLRNKRAEWFAGYFVIFTIFVSACVSGVEAINRLYHPQDVNNIHILIIGGIVGFIGNELAAIIRLRAGKCLCSAALIADGQHARADGLVSLSVIISAVLVDFGFPILDPIIGLVITFVILRITWHSYVTIREG